MYHFFFGKSSRNVTGPGVARGGLRQYRGHIAFTRGIYRFFMDAIPNELTKAALASRERLSGYARTAAQAGTSEGRPASLTAMASAAREAIFADALTAAMHARLEELKSVAK